MTVYDREVLETQKRIARALERIADRMEPQKPHNDTLKEYIAQITREEDDRK